MEPSARNLPPRAIPRTRLASALVAAGLLAVAAHAGADPSAGAFAPAGRDATGAAAAGKGAKFTIPLLDPSALSFSTPLGTHSLRQRLTATNTSGAPVSVFAPNGISSEFTYVSDCPAASALPDGGSCHFDIDYRPVDMGTDTIVFPVNSSAGLLGVATVTGTAFRPATPLIQASPAAIDFAPTTVGCASDIEPVTLRSTSTLPVNLGISSVGDFADLVSLAPVRDGAPSPAAGRGGKFTLILPCSEMLAAGDPEPAAAPEPAAKFTLPTFGSCYGFLLPMESCVLGMVFLPTRAGTHEGLLLVSSDLAQGQFAIPLRGVARAAGVLPVLTIPEAIDFGRVPVGGASAARAFAITNNTAAQIAVDQLTVEGDFQVEKAGCATIAPLATCTANLVFRPQALGTRVGRITVRTPADGLAFVASLTGTGIPNPQPLLTLSALQLGFGNGLVGGASALAVTATNSGQLPVAIGRIYAVGDFQPSHTCPSTLAPGASCAIDVGFTPRLRGLRTGALVIESNALGSPHAVQLKGTGCGTYSTSVRGAASLCSGS